MTYKLGSLFDGSGGFPLAGALCGVTPAWAAEVEPYPIAVTRSRFPDMRHLGDVRKVNGAEIEPVDIITFGSPCQDLSTAGQGRGLKHTAKGDDETTRSGLFMEAVRIIKEMRKVTNGKHPRFALFENVHGAFSSNRGEDFRTVLAELIGIVEPAAVMPPVPKAGWNYADDYRGDGWSLAYRVFDAQYWGVPQRRRRIHLVVDFRGERAREVLFKREGVRGYFAQNGATGQGVAPFAEADAGTADKEEANDGGHGRRQLDAVAYTLKIRSGVAVDSAGKAAGKGALIQVEKSATLAATQDQYLFQPQRTIYRKGTRPHNTGEAQKYVMTETANTLNTYDLGETRANEIVLEPIPIHDKATRYKGKRGNKSDGGANGLCVGNPGDKMYTLTSGDRHAIMCSVETQYLARRLTPTEYARLQGFADRWGDIDEKKGFSPEEYQFWLDVRNTHAAINGRAVKDYSETQMLTWYNKLHTDAAEYKMWGNGIALPPALYCLQGMVDVLTTVEDDDAWML